MKTPPFSSSRPASARGFSLVELMVAMTIGLVLTGIMTSVFVSSRAATRRQSQLGEIQQSVRVAFEYLTFDARGAGHRGCATGRTNGFVNTLSQSAFATSYGQGVEGYEYTLSSSGYSMSSAYPANATASAWATNTADPVGINTIPYNEIIGSSAAAANQNTGLSPGSDVLVLRSTVGAPARLTTPTATVTVLGLILENTASSGTCPGGTAKQSGFCPGSHGLIATCTDARTFTVGLMAGTAMTFSSPLSLTAGVIFPTATAEVFPMQTVAYYVARSSNGTSMSLYRRVLDGTVTGGTMQELVEGVENLQVRYGVDTTTPTPDGIVDEYVRANEVGDWSRVVAVRMGLLVRSMQRADAAVAASALVDNTTVTFPTSGDAFDRRVFTTTVAVRNRIAF